MADLCFAAVSAGHDGRAVLKDVSLRLAPGTFAALLGPNGAGKTTLLRAALGLLPTQAGAIALAGADPRGMSGPARARIAAYLPQSRPLAWPLQVRDLVALGRFAYGATLGRLGAADERAVARALAACDLEGLAQRRIDCLSGGELARAHVARALAAEAPIILADEPTAALDPLQAWRVMELLARFAASGGAVLAAIHDVTLAARFANRAIVLAEGRIAADGPVLDVLTPDVLRLAYGVAAQLETSAHGPVLSVAGPA
jgi:iron complex transport system ATP-binding protein